MYEKILEIEALTLRNVTEEILEMVVHKERNEVEKELLRAWCEADETNYKVFERVL